MFLISVAALAEIFVLFEISCLAIASNICTATKNLSKNTSFSFSVRYEHSKKIPLTSPALISHQ